MVVDMEVNFDGDEVIVEKRKDCGKQFRRWVGAAFCLTAILAYIIIKKITCRRHSSR